MIVEHDRELSAEPEMEELASLVSSGRVRHERVDSYLTEEGQMKNGATIEADEVLTLEEAMSFLKVSRATFYKLMKQEGLAEHGRKVGNRWRFTRRGLLSWIDQK